MSDLQLMPGAKFRADSLETVAVHNERRNTQTDRQTDTHTHTHIRLYKIFTATAKK